MSSSRPPRIALIGGHLTPALAMADYIQSHHPQLEVVFFGRHYSQDRVKQLSHEYKEVTKRKIPFVAVQAPRLPSWQTPSMIWLWPQLMMSYFVALGHLWNHRPTVLVSFGGYLAVPLCLAAWCLGIPVVTHEQTRAPGQANRLIAHVARKIAVTFPETAKYFPANRVAVTGNPLRPNLLQPSTQTPSWLTSTPALPLLYVTGGNQGSEALNRTVGACLSQLTESWLVIHQCGNPTAQTNYKRELEALRRKLPAARQRHYFVQEWITDQDLAWIFQHASLVISRSGANTVYELAALQVPSILVPLPIAREQEQYHNAEWLAAAGGAINLPQKELTPAALTSLLIKLKRKLPSMKRNLATLELRLDADKALFELITKAGRFVP